MVIRRLERQRRDGLTEKEQAHLERIRTKPGECKRPRLTHCKRGHRFTKMNTFTTRRGFRQCRTCRDLLRRGRPLFVEQGGVKVYINAHDRFFAHRHRQLRHQMIAAHPDKGGTTRQFMQARSALDRFIREEAMWYAALNLHRPAA